MSQDLISKKTRYEFREYLVSWYLRQIEMEFDAADIACRNDYNPATTGQRRSLVEQYYASLDFSKWDDVRKILKVYENVLNFAAESSQEAASRLAGWLAKDGFAYQNREIVSLPGAPLLPQIKSISAHFGTDHMARQIKRMEESVDSDPPLAIGSAKELIETCCKTILDERGCSAPKDADIPALVKLTLKELKLVPDNIPDSSKGADTIKRMLSNLGTIGHDLAELRNLYGSGHGKHGRSKGLAPRHFETHKESAKP